MPTPAQLMDIAASDMNDTAQENYTDAALLPYLNMALREFLERLEENHIPVTNSTSSNVEVEAGDTEITFGGSPALPDDLVEIQQIWESNDDGDSWIPMSRVDFIDPNIATGQELAYFGQWAPISNGIKVPEAATDIILRIQYVRKIVNLPLSIDSINVNLPLLSCDLFIGHKTGALAATLIAQDNDRALVLNTLAEEAIARALNIPIKGQQAITTRRRPFRSSYKARGRIA